MRNLRQLRLLSLLLVTTAACATGPGQSAPTGSQADQLHANADQTTAEGKADGSSCSGIVPPDRPLFGGHIALTFDDGPNPATTPQVLKILRAHNAPATFFINGVKAQSSEAKAILADVAADPLFHLGNHSWSHPLMTKLSADAAAAQIDDNTAVIKAAGGHPRYFRFPFGAANCTLAAAVRSRGYHIVGWNIDSADWCFSTGTLGVCPKSRFKYVDDDVRDDMLAYVMRQVRRWDGGILLFHDIHQYTADQLDTVLSALEDAGYTFVGLDDTDTFPLLNGITPPPVTPPQGSTPAHVSNTSGGLWLRQAPSATASRVTLMPEGATIAITGDADGSWYPTWYDGHTGWAYGNYITLDN